MKLAGLCFLLTAPAVAAQDYACLAWADTAPEARDISAVSVGKTLLTYTEGGVTQTTRLSHGTLTRKTYLDDVSAIVIYGDWVRLPDGTPGFGPRISLQRFYFDAAAPQLFQTTCEATR